jgi:RNA polymerase sigma-70 factor (ECF subfamily)
MDNNHARLCRLADEELMREVSNMNSTAFEIIYDRHSNAVYSLSYRIVGTASSAEDVCQEAFLIVWRNGARYQAHLGSVRSWLLSIARNRAIDNIRQVTRHQQNQTSNQSAAEQRPDEANTETDVIKQMGMQETKELLLVLPAEQRQVIELSFYSGYSHSEIANHLQIPLGTVKGRMGLALNKMRQSLGEDINELL